MNSYVEYRVTTEKNTTIVESHGQAEIDTITLAEINKKCSEYGYSLEDLISYLLNSLTMNQIEEILLSFDFM